MVWYTGRSFLEASHDGEVVAAEGQNHGSEAEYSQGKVHAHLLTMNSHQLGVRRQEITMGSMHKNVTTQ